ncbi:hypothetical protein CYMTET_28736 [Cymbomonas tetramitiformis]|uniref:Uncharacterized protein n=1 Tax=Cymbomonas tetramitiformis TaxID=36881 RepID=A0AAE0FMN4_9CHLO|nr:hypothetical protein CYMTET_28736 [Cymbomonas tetramitiformis]
MDCIDLLLQVSTSVLSIVSASAIGGDADFFSWLEYQVAMVWQDPYCGDSTCNEPIEFPSFGRLTYMLESPGGAPAKPAGYA